MEGKAAARSSPDLLSRSWAGGERYVLSGPGGELARAHTLEELIQMALLIAAARPRGSASGELWPLLVQGYQAVRYLGEGLSGFLLSACRAEVARRRARLAGRGGHA